VALGATPPPLAVASLPAVAFAKVGCHHIRPQNRRAVVLAVRFCSLYLAAGSFRTSKPITGCHAHRSLPLSPKLNQEQACKRCPVL
jgi:hypothetical protein